MVALIPFVINMGITLAWGISTPLVFYFYFDLKKKNRFFDVYRLAAFKQRGKFDAAGGESVLIKW